MRVHETTLANESGPLEDDANRSGWGAISHRVCKRSGEHRFRLRLFCEGRRYVISTLNGRMIDKRETAERLLEQIRAAARSGEHQLAVLRRYTRPVYTPPNRLPAGAQEPWQEQYRRRMLSGAQRRAAQRGIPFDLTIEDVPIPLRCPVFGIELTPAEEGGGRQDTSPSIERVDCSRGYVRGNVCVVSWRANKIKSDATAAELAKVAEWAAYMEQCPPDAEPLARNE